MRHFLTSLILFISTLSWSQEGFKVIRKAEKCIEHGQYKKALNLLDKAEKMDHGFCGNAWLEADEAIAVNRAKIYISQKEPLKAANSLNNLNFWSSSRLDSTKTAYFIERLGKELVKQQIDSCITELTSADLDGLHLPMEFTLDVQFSEEPFGISYETCMAVRNGMITGNEEHQDTGVLEQFKIALRKQAFYLLLE